jgi:hypothetical protein
MISRILFAVSYFLICVIAASAQSTAFTYQGKLSENGSPANGSYEFEFTLFAALTGGTQIGPVNTREEVMVINGIFTVQLDFGATALNGGNRFLEISVRPSDGPGGSVLTPRQQITSSPYAVKSINAASADGLSVACVGCVTSGQIQTVQGAQITGSISGSQISGPIPVGSMPSGSSSYVQNTTSPQASSNFNISGDGTLGGTLSANAATFTTTASASIFSAATQFNINNVRVLGVAGNGNLFAGANSGTLNTGSNNAFFGAAAGASNTTGASNAFFGTQAGAMNVSGERNTFFGYRAGFQNTDSYNNSFFGYRAGELTTGLGAGGNSFFGFLAGAANTFGASNAFFGESAGNSNTTGGANSFFGSYAGRNNTTSFRNSFFGRNAGELNTTGADNSFYGMNAGRANTTANNNSYFGSGSGEHNTTGTDNAFFGFGTGMANNGSDNSFFGSRAGYSNTTGKGNNFFGIDAGYSNTTGSFNNFYGRETGQFNTTGIDNSFFGEEVGRNNTTGFDNAFFGFGVGINNSTGFKNTFIGSFTGRANTVGNRNTAVGIDADFGSDNLTYATAIGAGSVASLNNSIFLGRPDGSDSVRIPGTLVVSTLGSGGSTSICLNVANRISSCSSSLRYKTSLQSFSGGLDVVRRLRPITFNWKDDGLKDVGFAAEEVEKIEPLLTTRNPQGEIEGVKYGQLTAVLVNAVKEQQRQIEEQKHQITEQQKLLRQQQQQNQVQLNQLRLQQQQLDALKRLICSSHPQTDLCK